MIKLVVLALLFLIFAFTVWIHSVKLDESESDVLIILGYKCFNNKIPPILEERLMVAKDLAERKGYKKIIVTGGKVASDTSEAVLMKQYLVDHGISPDDIILETEALDTIENMLNCKEIILKSGLKTSTVISNSFHLRRILYICREIDFPIKVYCERDFKALINQFKLTLSEARIFVFVYIAFRKMNK